MSRPTLERLLVHPAFRALAAVVALWAFVVPLVAGEGPAEIFGGLFAAWTLTIGALALLGRVEDHTDV